MPRCAAAHRRRERAERPRRSPRGADTTTSRAIPPAMPSFFGSGVPEYPLLPVAMPRAPFRVRPVAAAGSSLHRRACQPLELGSRRFADPSDPTFLTVSLAFRARRIGTSREPATNPRSKEEAPCRCDWATKPRTSLRRRPTAPSTSTTTSATAGACCSRTRRTSPRCAPPSSAPSPSARASSTSAASSSSASASTRSSRTRAGSSDIEETQGTALNFPLIADPDRKVADLYDMIHPNANDTLTVRSVFVIGPDKKVKLIITYPASTGRNIDEILRVIDSLQLTANYQVATPVELERRRRRDHRAGPLRRGGQGEVPEGLERGEALPARHPAAQQVALTHPQEPRRLLRPTGEPLRRRPTPCAASQAVRRSRARRARCDATTVSRRRVYR